MEKKKGIEADKILKKIKQNQNPKHVVLYAYVSACRHTCIYVITMFIYA